MKKVQFALAALFLVKMSFSQVTFCPQGAQWHFLNKSGADSFPWEKSETVKYERDTLVDGMLVKVLSHSSFFMENSWSCKLTLIKQAGDTVFLRNELTQHTWQVLYNFNTTVGQSWYNTFTLPNNPGGAVLDFTTTVNSTGTVNVNGSTLKRLFVKSYSDASNVNLVYNIVITERFGGNPFLFYWYIFSHIQVNTFKGILCYEDNTWPLQQFTNKPCYYENILGMSAEGSNTIYKEIRVSPNPVVDFLAIEWKDLNTQGDLEIVISDISGKRAKQSILKPGDKIMMSDLREGMYLLQIHSESRLIYSEKIIKQ